MDFGRVESVKGRVLELPTDDERSFEFLSHGTGNEVFVGCPIWSKPEWKGLVYPVTAKSTDFLRYYAKQFNTIELNSTFYHLPPSETLEKWLGAVDEDFLFCPKIPKSISHESGLLSEPEILKNHFTMVERMGWNYGCSFLQLPPGYRIDRLGELASFFNLWHKEFALAVEFRHDSWFEKGRLCEKAFDLLREKGVGVVITDVAGRRDVLHTSLTAPFTFIRFSGYGLVESDFERMTEWVLRLRSWMERGLSRVYFMAHQPDDTFAPQTASHFIKTMNERADLDLREPEYFDSQEQMQLF